MQETPSNSPASATETLDGFSFAKWVIDVHQKNGDPVTELLKAAKMRETDWLEKKAAVYPSAEHDSAYKTLLETQPKDLEHQKKLYPNEIHKEIVAAVIALRHSRGGVVLIGVDDDNQPVPLLEKQNENSPNLSGNKIDSFGRDQIIRDILSRPKFQFIGRDEDKKKTWTETWTFSRPVGSEDITIRELAFKGNPVLALLVPPLPLESKDFLVAEVSKNEHKGEKSKGAPATEGSKKESDTNQKRRKVLLRRTSGDAVGQTKKKTIEDDWIENEAQLGEFIRQRKELFFDNGDLARLRRDLSRVIPFAVQSPIADHFVGRDNELRNLHQFLSDGKTLIVTGPGGMGKSELVLQYAAKHKADYPGGLFQIDMERAKDWDDAFRKLLGTTEHMHRILGFSEEVNDREDKREPHPKEIAGALARRAKEEGRILLVLDNVEDVGAFFGESIFERNAALSPDVRTIVTARKSDIQFEKADRCVEFPLDDLPSDAALKLLLSSHPADSDTERQAAARIAEELGYRPLYLCRIRSLLKGKPKPFARSYAELESKLRESECRLKTVGTAMEKTLDQDRTPEALWILTREALSADGESGAAWIKLAHIASFFSPEGFQKHILRHLWGELAAPEMDADESFDEALEVLRWHWLLAEDGEVLRMHRLNADVLRLFARKESPEIEKNIGQTLSGYLGMRTADWISLANSFSILRQIPAWRLRAQTTVGYNHGDICICLAVQLIARNPSLHVLCRWNQLDGTEWGWLLGQQPQFAKHCDWAVLDGRAWAGLLQQQPQFADKCSWESLEPVNWCDLLQKQPQFADKCPWDDLGSYEWASLLREQPQFADKCHLDELDIEWWSYLLEKQPQFANTCPWDRLEKNSWAALLQDQPQFADKCPWDRFDTWDWVNLLGKQPQFADKCPWEKFGGPEWSSILTKQPQFSERCSWDLLTRGDDCWWLCALLSEQPQFADHCPWEKLREHDWFVLLKKQPQFSDRCPWEMLNDPKWHDQKESAKPGWPHLISSQPQFAEHCVWDNLDNDEWRELLSECPQYANHCFLEKLDGWVWPWLLCEQPQFANKCPWKQLNGGNWTDLLMDRPRFSNKCPWKTLDGANWAELLKKQPQFSKQCYWEKLDAYDWRQLLDDQPHFLDILGRMAAQGNARAKYYIGSMYEVGSVVERDDETALAWYLEAAQQGDSYAQFTLGQKLEEGRGIAQSFKKSVAWYRKAARQGNPHAQFNLGVMYEAGRGVKQSDAKAALWFRKAAQQRISYAQFNLGVMYEAGRGVKQSDAKAVAWYRKAAEQGNDHAQFSLGVMLETGRGIRQNCEEAVSWYQEAALLGNSHARFNLGLMYLAGRGVKQSDAEAVEWFREAAEQGIAQAQFCLGTMRETGRGIEQRHEEAVAWYKKAAEQGLPAAQWRLGHAFETGNGIAKNYEESVAWYRKAAEQGLPQAQFDLGRMYMSGRGVERRDKKAAGWFRKAAEAGSDIGLAAWGHCLRFGIGVRRNDTKANALFSKMNNAAEAFNALAWTLLSLNQADQALPYAEKAAEAVRKQGNEIEKKLEILDTLAAIQDKLEKWKDSKATCEEELSLFPAGDESNHREEALVRLGRACQSIGDNSSAIDAFAKALVVVEKHGGKHAEYGESADELRRLIRKAGGAEP